MRLERFRLHPGTRVAFTGRQQGNLATHTGQDEEQVRTARASLVSELGIAPGSLRSMSQVHSADVAEVDAEGGAIPVADALVDPQGQRALLVLTADCVPVAFAATTGTGATMLAVAHAGRPGLLAGVLPATVARLRQTGGTDIEARIGPCVCAGCYEVPQAMQDDAEAVLAGIGSRTRWGTPSLDLPGAAARQLEELGVSVAPARACTLEDPGLFSYRGGDRTDRIGTLVWNERAQQLASGQGRQ